MRRGRLFSANEQYLACAVKPPIPDLPTYIAKALRKDYVERRAQHMHTDVSEDGFMHLIGRALSAFPRGTSIGLISCSWHRRRYW
jgi:hypothetical protein